MLETPITRVRMVGSRSMDRRVCRLFLLLTLWEKLTIWQGLELVVMCRTWIQGCSAKLGQEVTTKPLECQCL
jgi:hypothetical protein